MTSHITEVLITGGTIDVFDINNGTYIYRDSFIPRIIKNVRVNGSVKTKTIFLKDSLYITSHERALILEAVKSSNFSKIIITHGTDTMTETARLIGSDAVSTNKTIVLTGAMVPYIEPESDALFNLGSAFSAVQLAPPGTYISMNGTVFPWNRVHKNKEKKVFEYLDKPEIKI